jgi:hypothetical protein
MNNTVTCQFAVIRFLPYPETQEFVNVGVALGCPEIGFFDFRLEMQRRDRVNRFFSELDPEVYVQGRKMFHAELDRMKHVLSDKHARGNNWLLEPDQQAFSASFRAFVRPHESVFRFGGLGVSLAMNPGQELDALFDHFVRRQFAAHRDYQEKVMTDRLRMLFRERNVRGMESMEFEDGLYRVAIPFVRTTEHCMVGVKPLHFGKSDTTRILDYGDHWYARIRRLQGMPRHPERLVLVMHMPSEGRLAEAAQQARDAIQQLHGVVLVEETDRGRIVELTAAG